MLTVGSERTEIEVRARRKREGTGEFSGPIPKSTRLKGGADERLPIPPLESPGTYSLREREASLIRRNEDLP